MKISSIKAFEDGDAVVLSAKIKPRHALEHRFLWFRYRGLDSMPAAEADPFVVAMLPASMHDGEPCEVDRAISPKLSRNLLVAQRRLASWFDFLRPVPVLSAPPGPADGRPAGRRAGTACCFSGGVDSWYSLIKHRHAVTHILLVRGFDIGLENDALWHSTVERIGAVAQAMDLRLVTCETNLRSVADKGRPGWGLPYDGDFWGQCLHGAALAAVALPLSPMLGTLIVPATHSEDSLRAWGSSPFLDPHWSNERLAIVHDGCEADRLQKVRTIAGDTLARQSLRVCHDDRSTLNCGECEKCVRTMLALELCGALDEMATFPRRRGLAKLRRLEIPAHLQYHYERLRDAAILSDNWPLAHRIESALGRRPSIERSLALLVRRARGIQLRGHRRTPLAAPGSGLTDPAIPR
ncbi:MAG: hypothetical protein RIB84_29135 [Sneathiellaceae bacterium]